MSDKLLSCLCVSVPSRWGLLQRAVLDYHRQSYPSRELIIVVKEENYAAQIESYTDSLFGTSNLEAVVKVFQRPGHDVAQMTLYALAQCRGDFITFWSDDNQNTPDRLQTQMQRQVLVPSAYTVMTDCFYHFFDTREVFWTRFESPLASAADRCVPSSLIAPRDLLPPIVSFFRDHLPSKIIDAVSGPHHRRKIHFMPTSGMFMAGVRGDNIRGYEKHRVLATGLPMTYRTDALSEATTKTRVTGVLDQLFFDTEELYVCGADGTHAFAYRPGQHYPDHLFPIGEPDGIKKIEERK